MQDRTFFTQGDRELMAIQAQERSTGGFTLVEVLIAIFIFSIIVTTVFASHRSVFISAPIVESNIDLYEMSRTCLGRVTQDLRAIYIAQSPAYQKPEFDADPDPHRVFGAAEGDSGSPRLRFASLAHLPLEQSSREGVAQIVYYETPVDEDTFRLRRADNLYPYPDFEADERDPVLCEKVKSLKITFLDQEGNEYEYWDSESDEFDYATPVAVSFLIELVKDGSASFFETRVSLPVLREPLE